MTMTKFLQISAPSNKHRGNTVFLFTFHLFIIDFLWTSNIIKGKLKTRQRFLQYFIQSNFYYVALFSTYRWIEKNHQHKPAPKYLRHTAPCINLKSLCLALSLTKKLFFTWACFLYFIPHTIHFPLHCAPVGSMALFRHNALINCTCTSCGINIPRYSCICRIRCVVILVFLIKSDKFSLPSCLYY